MKRPEKVRFIPLTDPSQIPDEMTEDEARTFWDTHELTETFLEKSQLKNDDGPPTRQQTFQPPRVSAVPVVNSAAERFQTKKVTRK